MAKPRRLLEEVRLSPNSDHLRAKADRVQFDSIELMVVECMETALLLHSVCSAVFYQKLELLFCTTR
jgi:hypothetical protein